ncbi:MAG: DUF2868 domain-containing protein, partial [Thauera sp.]|nr:DUF2868 domain-containing protein [Thauera sp.]
MLNSSVQWNSSVLTGAIRWWAEATRLTILAECLLIEINSRLTSAICHAGRVVDPRARGGVHALRRRGCYPSPSRLPADASSGPRVPTSFPPNSLTLRWLAELVRRHEERHPPLDEARAHAEARAVAGDLEARVLRRAAVLEAASGWREAIRRWQGRARLVLVLAFALAFVFGFGAAAGALGDGTRPVNVVWTLGGLLGVHLLSLLLWLASLVLQARAQGDALHHGGVLGRAWLAVTGWLDRSREAAELPLALGSLLGGGRTASWGVGAANHALWFGALAGATLGVLALLATRRYGFVWETTILPADTFVALSAALGALPGVLGFPVPDAATVLASGDAPMLDEAGRRAWAGWLVGAMTVYGVLPRLALALLCFGLWRRATRTLALDLGRPGYARLRPLLMPDSERIGVRDPEPAAMPRPQRNAPVAQGGGGAVAVALELGDDLPWPGLVRAPAAPPAPGGTGAGWEDGGRLDSREQRRAVRERFAAHPPARLLVVVDGRQTPDRGSLGLIADLADH